MTPGQRQCLHFIRNYIDSTGGAPSYQELCDGLKPKKISKGGAHRYTKALILQGYLERDTVNGRSAARGLRITLKGRAEGEDCLTWAKAICAANGYRVSKNRSTRSVRAQTATGAGT